MSTYMAKAGEVSRKWYILDAAGKPLGGWPPKPSVCCAANTSRNTPPRRLRRPRHYHQLRQGGAHRQQAEPEGLVPTFGMDGRAEGRQVLNLDGNPSEKATQLAVNGMLPNNTIGRAARTRLRVYAGPEHLHDAQKPEKIEL